MCYYVKWQCSPRHVGSPPFFPKEFTPRGLFTFLSQTAFLALQAGAPVLPVSTTGIEWSHLLPAYGRLRGPCDTLTVGQPFRPDPGLDRQVAAHAMMRQIAAPLPPEYRGVYAEPVDDRGTQHPTAGAR